MGRFSHIGYLNGIIVGFAFPRLGVERSYYAVVLLGTQETLYKEGQPPQSHIGRGGRESLKWWQTVSLHETATIRT